VPPSNPAFLRLSDGAVLGKPQPAGTTEDFRITPPPVGKPADLRPAPIVVTVPPSTGDTTPGSPDEHASAGRKKADQHTQPQGSAH